MNKLSFMLNTDLLVSKMAKAKVVSMVDLSRKIETLEEIVRYATVLTEDMDDDEKAEYLIYVRLRLKDLKKESST